MDNEFDSAAEFLNREKEMLGDLESEIINGREINRTKFTFLSFLMNH